MSSFIKKQLINLTTTGLLLFFQSSTVFSDSRYDAETTILTRYIMPGKDKTVTECLLTGRENKEDRAKLQAKGCTLDTLMENQNINVEITVETPDKSHRFFMNAKYYLMWVNTGLHAVNVFRFFPFPLLTPLLDIPKNSIYSGLYATGFHHNARKTFYPYIKDKVYSYFFPNNKKGESDSAVDQREKYSQPPDDQSAENESIYKKHLLVFGVDLFMWWWVESYVGGGRPNISKLIALLDLLSLACEIATDEQTPFKQDTDQNHE